MDHFERAHFSGSWDVVRVVNGVCQTFKSGVMLLMLKTPAILRLDFLPEGLVTLPQCFGYGSHLEFLVSRRSQTIIKPVQPVTVRCLGKPAWMDCLSSPTVTHLTLAHILLDLCIYKISGWLLEFPAGGNSLDFSSSTVLKSGTFTKAITFKQTVYPAFVMWIKPS